MKSHVTVVMTKAAAAGKQLGLRKKPSQQRSQKMVENILSATRDLLRQSDGPGAARITTNHIAARAEISVGSLYQYFPNTEAILFAIYQDMLGQIQEVMQRFDSADYLSLPRDKFFDRLFREVTDAEADDQLLFAMHGAMKAYPVLVEADRAHAEKIADELARFCRHYGSRWSAKKLRRLGLYVYYIDGGTWTFRNHAKPPVKEVLDWEIKLFKTIISQCFE